MTATERLLTGRSSQFVDGLSQADILLTKQFFSAHGFLPPNIVLENLYDYPPPDFANDNGGTRSLSMSRMKFSCANNATSNFGWDMGSLKGEMLAIFGMTRSRDGGMGLFFSSVLPAAAEIPDGSYTTIMDFGNFNIFKKAGGVLTSLGQEPTWGPGNDNAEPSTGVAFYYNSSTNRLIMFVRSNESVWAPVVDVTDVSFSTMRYAGLRFGAVGTPAMWSGCPVAIYSS
jgi:hypothetical protein